MGLYGSNGSGLDAFALLPPFPPFSLPRHRVCGTSADIIIICATERTHLYPQNGTCTSPKKKLLILPYSGYSLMKAALLPI